MEIPSKADKEPLHPVTMQDDKEEQLYMGHSGNIERLPSAKGRNIVILKPPDNTDTRPTKACRSEDNTVNQQSKARGKGRSKNKR